MRICGKLITVICLIWAVLHPQNLFAQSEAGTEQTALLGASVAEFQDVFSTHLNPALIDPEKRFSLGFAFSPSPFGLKELTKYITGATLNLDDIQYSLTASTYGYELYRESDAMFSAASDFAGISIGLGINLRFLSIQNYGSSTIALINGGISYSPLKNLSLGFSMINAGNRSYSGTEDQIGQKFLAGLVYLIEDENRMYFRISKETGYPIAVTAGLSIEPHTGVLFMGSADITNRIYATGLGLEIFNAKLNYSALIHPLLGLSHFIGTGITFN